MPVLDAILASRPTEEQQDLLVKVYEHFKTSKRMSKHIRKDSFEILGRIHKASGSVIRRAIRMGNRITIQRELAAALSSGDVARLIEKCR